MYVSSDALFQLVKTLQPDELKAFQKTLKQSANGKSNYTHLFDALHKTDHYDEEKIKGSLQKYMSDGSFTVVKNQLNERLLNFLCENQTSITKKLHRWLEYIELLVVQKKLFHEADVYIERVKKEARRHSLLYLVLEANKWKRAILQYIHHDNYQKASDMLAQEILSTAEAVLDGCKIGHYYALVMSAFPQNLNLRSSSFLAKLEDLKRHEYFALHATNENLSFLSACYLAMAKNFLFKFTGELEKAYEQEQIVWNRLNEDWEWFYTNKHEETIASTINYLEALSSTSHTEAFTKQIDFAETLIAKEKAQSTYLEGAVKFYRLMNLFNTQGEKITDADLVPFIEYYENGKTDKYIEMKRLYEAYICRGFFLLRKYDEAITRYDAVIQEFGRNDARQDYYENALCTRLLIRFTKEVSISYKKMNMDEFIGEVNRYIEQIRHKPKDNDYRFEYAFMDFFKAIKNKPDLEKVVSEIDTLEQKATQLFAENTPFFQLTRIHFDFPLLIGRWKNYLSA